VANELDNLPKVVRDLVEKQNIYENLMRYVRGQDRKDLAMMQSAYWPDGTDDHAAFVGNGREFCQWAYDGQKVSGHSALHHCSNVLIELDGENQAKCESVFLYVMIFADKNVTKVTGGRYRDLCEKRDGEWKILRRVCIFDYAHELEGAKDFFGIFNMPATTVFGDLYPNDPIYQEW